MKKASSGKGRKTQLRVNLSPIREKPISSAQKQLISRLKKLK